MRHLPLLGLAACHPIYDDIDIVVSIPVSVQADFAAAHPGAMMRVVTILDGEPGSLAVLCDLGTADAEVSAYYLQVGCYEEHDLDVYLLPLDKASGVPCGNNFELGQGGRDAKLYAPVASLVIPVGEKGRCGEWTAIDIAVEQSLVD